MSTRARCVSVPIVPGFAWGVLFLAAILSGCAGTDSQSSSGAEDPAKEEISVLGFAYHYYHDSFRRGPETMDDLEKGNLKPGKLKELHAEEYELNPKLVFRELGDKMPSTWLVRRKDAATAGGYVFMADGTVQKVAASDMGSLHSGDEARAD